MAGTRSFRKHGSIRKTRKAMRRMCGTFAWHSERKARKRSFACEVDVVGIFVLTSPTSSSQLTLHLEACDCGFPNHVECTTCCTSFQQTLAVAAVQRDAPEASWRRAMRSPAPKDRKKTAVHTVPPSRMPTRSFPHVPEIVRPALPPIIFSLFLSRIRISFGSGRGSSTVAFVSEKPSCRTWNRLRSAHKRARSAASTWKKGHEDRHRRPQKEGRGRGGRRGAERRRKTSASLAERPRNHPT